MPFGIQALTTDQATFMALEFGGELESPREAENMNILHAWWWCVGCLGEQE